MSLTKLLKAPIKLFKKEVISFIIIRRYDLGIPEEKFRFIGVKPSASMSSLRRKVWCLLELPDFCEEVIVLKSQADVVLPLSDLKRGNDPQHPYIMEVYLPGHRPQPTAPKTGALNNKLLTIENGDEHSGSDDHGTYTKLALNESTEYKGPGNSSLSMNSDIVGLNKTMRFRDDKTQASLGLPDFRKSELSCRLSSSSIFRLSGRKNSENFTTLLMKMQSDLSTLSNKLLNLESRILT